MSANSRRVKEVFGAAIEYSDLAERQAFVERECAGEAELRHQVEALLAAHDQPNSVLQQPVGVASDEKRTGPHVPAVRELAVGGTFAGRYKVREKVGEGGMGSVYVADQTEPVARRVALKVIKADVSSARLLARFEQERQALALMDHPNIAKVLDAGVCDGVPYFVMELIKGVPITKYCDEARLTPRQRLELFIPMCQAVQHAHQKGVIHRDLKPSNILVGLYDGKPVPKVIDFGVAKATGSKLSEHSVYTEVGQVIGTLEYMSPEQAELNNLDVDTRTDVYALGVVLYELLTGTVPLSRKELKAAGYQEMLRIIKEVEPPKPSTRLSGSGRLPSIAACRQMEPARLTKLLRGDLDWIVMKALEKDRGRRYETANGFALDVQRYLANEPVLAGPPGAAYRLKKFVQRNKAQVVAASVVLLALLAGVVGATWGYLRAERSRHEAVEAREAEAARAVGEREAREREADQRRLAEEQRNVAREQRRLAEANQKTAEQEKRIAQAVSEFFQYRLLCQANPTTQANAVLQHGGFATAASRNVTVRELLDRAAEELTPEKIDGNFPNQPTIQAEILTTVGYAYRGVGEPERAVAFLQRAATLKRQHLGAEHSSTLTTLHLLALAYRTTGKLADAIRLLEQVKEDSEKHLGPNHSQTLTTLNSLALAYRQTGKRAEALRLLEQVKEVTEMKLGADHPDTLVALANVASTYHVDGKVSEAIRLYEQVREAQEKKLGGDHPDTLNTSNNLAGAYRAVGKLPEAIRLYERVRDGREKKLGPEHPDTLDTLNNLGVAYHVAGKLPEAIHLFKQAREAQEKKLGADHPDTLNTSNNLAGAYRAVGKLPEAIRLFERVRDGREKKLGPDHPDTLDTLNRLATAYWRTKQFDKSIPLFETALKGLEAKVGRDNPSTLATVANLGVNYRDANRLDEALPLLEEAHRKGKSHASLAWVEGELLTAYVNAGKTTEAKPLLRDRLAADRKRLPADSPQLAGTLLMTGGQLLELKEHAEAESLLRECLTLREKLLEKKQALPWQVANVKSMLGAALLGQKKHADAEPLLVAGYDGLKKDEAAIPPQGKDNLTWALQRLNDLYDAIGNKDKADKYRKELEAAKVRAIPDSKK